MGGTGMVLDWPKAARGRGVRLVGSVLHGGFFAVNCRGGFALGSSVEVLPAQVKFKSPFLGLVQHSFINERACKSALLPKCLHRLWLKDPGVSPSSTDGRIPMS